MLILSASLPKSGSAWLLNMTNDLLMTAGFSDTRIVRDRYGLDFIKYDEFNIQQPTAAKLNILTSPPVNAHTFVVKTHFPPNRQIIDLLEAGKLKITYIFRDPRDITLSLLDTGKKLRQRGTFHRAGSLFNLQDAIAFCRKRLRNNWLAWRRIEGVFFIKYEDLVSDTQDQLRRLCEYCQIRIERAQLREIVRHHHADRIRKSTDKHHYHFNKGIVGRFNQEWNAHDIHVCNTAFDDFLKKMDYSV